MRSTVALHASPLGTWEMVSRGPHPSLDGQVARYCGYTERTVTPLSRRELPSSRVTLILSFGPSLDVRDPSRPDVAVQRCTSFVAALHDAYVITEHAGVQDGVQADLTPLAAGALLGVPMGALSHAVVALEDVLGTPVVELTERLAESSGWEARFALLDRFLAERLLAAPSPIPALARAFRRLEETHGAIPIRALARELGVSTRYLTAGFRAEVGLTPKRLARVLRLRHALALLERDDGRRFAEIAERCGYADQPHLNRDFRAFAGCSPVDLIGRLLPDGGGFSGNPEAVPKRPRQRQQAPVG